MKPKHLLLIVLATQVAWKAGAAPIAYDEVSLLVRMGESPAYIAQQARSRSLLRTLSPAQESALASQGATPSLLQALRDPHFVLSDAEAAAFEEQARQQKIAIQESNARDRAEARQKELALARAAAEAPAPEPAPREASSPDADYFPPYYDAGGGFNRGDRGRFGRGDNSGHHSSRPSGSSVTFHGPNSGPSLRSALNGPGSFTATAPTAISNNAVFTPGHR